MAQQPRGQGKDSDFEDSSVGTAPGAARPGQPRPAGPKPATGPRPAVRQTGSQPTARPPGPGASAPVRTSTQPGLTAPAPRVASTGVPAIDLGGSKNTSEFHKHLRNSSFSERATFESTPRLPTPDDDEPTEIGLTFDGNTPAKEVTSRDLWKAIHPSVQSREGRRAANLYQTVLDQFAVGVNPRYEPDAPDKPRGHIFLWDVTRAMNVEVPHFVGSRELSLGQTCLWIRDQGPQRGWLAVELARAYTAVNAGQPVVVMPKDPKNNQVALMRPGGLSPDNKPILCGAARKRASRMSPQEAFGVFAVLYYFHL